MTEGSGPHPTAPGRFEWIGSGQGMRPTRVSGAAPGSVWAPAASVAAALLAAAGQGPVVVAALLLAVGARSRVSAIVAPLAAVVVAVRFGAAGFDQLAGVQSVLGPAGWVGPRTGAASSWLASTAVVLAAASARGRGGRVAVAASAAAHGVFAAVLVVGPGPDRLGLRLAAVAVGAITGTAVAAGVARARAVRPAGAGSVSAAAAAVVLAGSAAPAPGPWREIVTAVLDRPGPSLDALTVVAVGGFALGAVADRVRSPTRFGVVAVAAATAIMWPLAGAGDGVLVGRRFAAAMTFAAVAVVASAPRSSTRDRGRVVAWAFVLTGAALVAAGLSLRAGDARVPLVVVGALVTVVTSSRIPGAAALVPVAVVAVIRIVGAVPPDPERTAWIGVAGGGLVALGAAAVALRARRPVLASPAALGVAAVVVATADSTVAAAAAALLAVGSVLAFAAGSPVGLVALVPGLAVVVQAASTAGTAADLAASGVVVAIAMVTTVPGGSIRPVTDPRGWWAAPAVIYAAVPVWGWSGTTPVGGSDPAVVLAVLALVAATGGLVVLTRPPRTWTGAPVG